MMPGRHAPAPTGNANFAWVQHFIHHLAPHGMAGFVLANGSMSSNQSGEGEIRKAIIEADLVDCMVALPGQLFCSTRIPVCLWFLTRNKRDKRFRSRSGETLFIDARKLGVLVDRVHRELTGEEISQTQPLKPIGIPTPDSRHRRRIGTSPCHGVLVSPNRPSGLWAKRDAPCSR
jgi:type I restriction-modification system DNA methylase subunit